MAVTYYADSDAAGTGSGLDWTNAKVLIQAAYDLIEASLTDDYIILYRALAGTVFNEAIDCTARTMNGFTITIQAAPGDEAVKDQWNTSIARVETNISSVALVGVNCPDVTIVGMQIHNLNNSGRGIEFFSTGTVADGVRIRSTGAGNPFYCNTASSTAKIQNFITNFFDGSTGGSEGIYIGSSATGSDILAYNGVIYGFDDGAEDDSPDDGLTCVNLAVINNVAQDFDSVANVDHCLSDDGSGTNAQTPSGASHTNEFVDPANEDFTAVETGNIQFGIGPSADANVPSPDIEGDPRSGSTAFIGVDEPEAAPSAGNPWYYYAQQVA